LSRVVTSTGFKPVTF